MAKARFWEGIRTVAVNERQRAVIHRLLDGFEGKLTTSKYARLIRNTKGGRSTSYSLVPLAAIPSGAVS
jgi:hypothetical protein